MTPDQRWYPPHGAFEPLQSIPPKQAASVDVTLRRIHYLTAAKFEYRRLHLWRLGFIHRSRRSPTDNNERSDVRPTPTCRERVDLRRRRRCLLCRHRRLHRTDGVVHTPGRPRGDRRHHDCNRETAARARHRPHRNGASLTCPAPDSKARVWKRHHRWPSFPDRLHIEQAPTRFRPSALDLAVLSRSLDSGRDRRVSGPAVSHYVLDCTYDNPPVLRLPIALSHARTPAGPSPQPSLRSASSCRSSGSGRA